ncbi:MAG: hypothetical protein ACKO4T_05740 [Planctomycetaceae bacterium]
MSRARAQSGPTISLFPFLAVLLCTMGALLVVLVIFSRSAKQAGLEAAEQARIAAAAADEARREELERARDELDWRVGQTQSIRDRTAEELAKARMQLAGTEEQARELADELDALARMAEALEGAATADDSGILELERRLAEARKALDEAKEKHAERPPAYAVVPYEGVNGTHRRPLYIECCLDGVWLQPEGIRLGPGDFEGPPGPGNPLASALRAAREHIARNPGESGDPGVQPYPLLLVRPSGVMAYYAARESIQSWGSEFGYQFIDEDWTLTYPPRDPALADAEMRAVDEARRRLEWLAQVRPPKRTKPAVQYRAATTRGGVVANGGPSVLGDQSRFDWTEEQANAAGGDGGAGPGRGFSAGGGDDGAATGAGGDAILGNRYAGPSKFYSGGPGGQGGQGAMGGGGSAPGGDSGLDGPDVAAATGGSPRGGSPAGGGSEAGGSGAAGGTSSAAGFGSDAGDSLLGSSQGGRARGGAGARRGEESSVAAGAGQAGGDAASGGTSGGGQWAGSAGQSAGGGSGQSAGAGGGGGGSGPSMPGLAQGGGAAAAGGAAGAAGATASLAGKRGSNWASLATMETPVPLTRPIRVECAHDEFRLVGDGGRVATRIPIGTHTIDSVDPLVREVHATVGRWGLAGDRMYWRPELVLSATPDGGARREDLERLLADSGIDTRRSEAREKVRNLPPVQRTGSLFPRR